MVIYNSNNDTVLFIRVKAKVNDQCIIIYGEKKFINFLSYLVIIKKMMKVVILWFHGYICCTNSYIYIYIYIQIHKVMWGRKATEYNSGDFIDVRFYIYLITY